MGSPTSPDSSSSSSSSGNPQDERHPTTKQHKSNKHPRDWLQRLVQHHCPKFDVASSPILVVAPMVDQSDLPFRLQCRQYGAHVCFTPMIHSRLLTTCAEYRRKFVPSPSSTTSTDDDDGTTHGATATVGPPSDRPLIAQLCGHDPDTVLQAAQWLEPHCDGIDLNCGCPQGIAKRGKYGAFLLEQPDIVVAVAKRLVESLRIPVSIKVRLLPGATRDESLRNSVTLYRRLVDEAGIAMLTVHGRTRHHKGHLTGSADWDAIAHVVHELSDRIPIVANGGISSWDDAHRCWKETGVDAVMSSEAILEYPALFHRPNIHGGDIVVVDAYATDRRPNELGRLHLAREYLRLAQQHPSDEGGQGSGLKCARMHVHRMLHADLQELDGLRQQVSDAQSLSELSDVLDELERDHAARNHDVSSEQLSWYVRHRQIVSINGLMVNLSHAKRAQESEVRGNLELEEDAGECFSTLFMEDDDSGCYA